MKDRIIEIIELGQPQSLIQRENAHITELIKTDLLIEELNEQLLLYNVVGRSEQLVCSCGYKKVKTTSGYECGNAKCNL
jgi:hypothetical protein